MEDEYKVTRQKLVEIEEEFRAGDLTKQGYEKKKAVLLRKLEELSHQRAQRSPASNRLQDSPLQQKCGAAKSVSGLNGPPEAGSQLSGSNGNLANRSPVKFGKAIAGFSAASSSHSSSEHIPGVAVLPVPSPSTRNDSKEGLVGAGNSVSAKAPSRSESRNSNTEPNLQDSRIASASRSNKQAEIDSTAQMFKHIMTGAVAKKFSATDAPKSSAMSQELASPTSPNAALGSNKKSQLSEVSKTLRMKNARVHQGIVATGSSADLLLQQLPSPAKNSSSSTVADDSDNDDPMLLESWISDGDKNNKSKLNLQNLPEISILPTGPGPVLDLSSANLYRGSLSNEDLSTPKHNSISDSPSSPENQKPIFAFPVESAKISDSKATNRTGGNDFPRIQGPEIIINKFGTITKRLVEISQPGKKPLGGLFGSNNKIHKSAAEISTRSLTDSKIERVQSFQKPTLPEPFHIDQKKSIEGFSPTETACIPNILRFRALSNPKMEIFNTVDSRGKEASLTLERLNGRAEKIATLLQELNGYHRGITVLLLYRRNEALEFISALFGCFYAGAAAVPVILDTVIDAGTQMSQILFQLETKKILTTDGTLSWGLKSKKFGNLPKDVEWFKTEELGVFTPSKRKLAYDFVPLEAAETAVIEFHRTIGGEYRGTVVSHGKYYLQTLMFHQKGIVLVQKDSLLSLIDHRHSTGLILSIFYPILTGTKTSILSSTETEFNWMSVVKKYRANVMVIDSIALRDDVQAIKKISTESMKKMQKSGNYDISSLHSIVADIELPSVRLDASLGSSEISKFLFNFRANTTRSLSFLVYTKLPFHGGLMISLRSSCENDKDFAEHTLGLHGPEFLRNRISIQHEGPNVPPELIKVRDTGLILPEISVAIVDHKTDALQPPGVLGEIWVRSPAALPTSYYKKTTATEFVFQSNLKLQDDRKGIIEAQDYGKYVRTGLIGFLHKSRLYCVELLNERIEIACLDKNETDLTRVIFPTDLSLSLTEAFQTPMAYHIIAFAINLNNEDLLVVVVEVYSPPNAETTLQQQANNQLCSRITDTIWAKYNIPVYAVLVCSRGSIPLALNGTPSLEYTRNFLDLGLLNPLTVALNARVAVRNLPLTFEQYKKISGAADQLNLNDAALKLSQAFLNKKDSMQTLQISDGNQFGSIGFGFGFIDSATKQDLLQFESISRVLMWRSRIKPDDIAYILCDSRGKETESLTFQKFSGKVARVADYLLTKKYLKPGNCVLLAYQNLLSFAITVHACLYTGIIPIPLLPPDTDYLRFDIPVLVDLIRQFKITSILCDDEAEKILHSKIVINAVRAYKKVKQSEQQLQKQQTSKNTESDLPEVINTAHAPKTHKVMEDVIHAAALSHFEQPGESPEETKGCQSNPLVMVQTFADYKFCCIDLSHDTLIAQCAVLKEFCNLNSNRPILASVRSQYGLGFLFTAILGIYVGCPTVLYEPADYAANPAAMYETLSRLQVKDGYVTHRVLEYAFKKVNPEKYRNQINLGMLKNLIVVADGRNMSTRVVGNHMAEFKLNQTAIAPSFSSSIHPIVSSRSYMAELPIPLHVDVKQLQRRKIVQVPKGSRNSITLYDYGRAAPCTTIAIIRPDTDGTVCAENEVGEIWVSGLALADSYLSNIPLPGGVMNKKIGELNGKLVGATEDCLNAVFHRTGDYGFLHRCQVPSYSDGGATMVEGHALFVLGSIEDTIQIEIYEKRRPIKLTYFPEDIENTIERCHNAIIRNGSVVFWSDGGLTVICELENHQKEAGNCLPLVVNAVLEECQLLVQTIIYIAPGTLPKSKFNEKQRAYVRNIFEQGQLSDLLSIHEIS